MKKEEKKKKERRKKHCKITFNHREHPQQKSQKDVAKNKEILSTCIIKQDLIEMKL